MHRCGATPRLAALVIAASVVVAACGSGSATTCEEVADETIDLVQTLIDDVEGELGDMSLQELASLGTEELPAVERFRDEAAAIDARAAELGCAQSQIQELVVERADSLEAETPIGRLVIDGVASGGL